MENFADVTAHTLKFIDQFANGFPSDKSEINAKLAEGRALLARYKGSGIIPVPESVARLIEITGDLHRLDNGEPIRSEQQRLATEARSQKALERAGDSNKPTPQSASTDKKKPVIDVRNRASVEAETARLRAKREAAQKDKKSDSTAADSGNAAVFAQLSNVVSKLEQLRTEIESETAQLEAENRTFAIAANEARRLRKLLRQPTAIGAIRSNYERQLQVCEKQMREILASRIGDKLNQYENLRALERSLTASRSKTNDKTSKDKDMTQTAKFSSSVNALLTDRKIQATVITERLERVEAKLASARQTLLETNNSYKSLHQSAARIRKELAVCTGAFRRDQLSSRLKAAESGMLRILEESNASLREEIDELRQLKAALETVNQ